MSFSIIEDAITNNDNDCGAISQFQYSADNSDWTDYITWDSDTGLVTVN